MFQTLLNLLFKNWKTTASGIASILVWVLDEIFKVGLTVEQKTFITTVVLGVGLFFSKDGNVTGGTNPQ